MLRESARHDRVETAARERLGLPLALAEDDGFAAVDERLSPRPSLRAALEALPSTSGGRSSCAWSGALL